MNLKSHVARLHKLAIRTARHLQLIVIILFLLYAIGGVAFLAEFPNADLYDQLFGILILLGVPLPLFVSEVLAVFRRWESAAYLCAACWIAIGGYLLLVAVFTVFERFPDWLEIAYIASIFVPAGLVALVLAVLHLEWPKLLHPSQRK
jgi:hypothetical protein